MYICTTYTPAVSLFSFNHILCCVHLYNTLYIHMYYFKQRHVYLYVRILLYIMHQQFRIDMLHNIMYIV